MILKTTIIGAVVNTVFNFLLIPAIGINGAGLATLIGFAIVMIIRENLLKKEDRLEVGFNRVPFLMLIIVQIVIYYVLPLWSSVILMTAVFGMLVFAERKLVVLFVKSVVCKLLKRS